MRRFVAFVLFCLFLLLTACTPIRSAAEWAKRIEAGASLPVGVWYHGGAEPWEEGYLPDALRPVFFGEGGETDVDYRLFLGTDGETLAELLVAVCPTEAAAVSLSEHLAVRLAYLREQGEEQFSVSLGDAAVRRRERTVFYTAVPCNKRVLDLF